QEWSAAARAHGCAVVAAPPLAAPRDAESSCSSRLPQRHQQFTFRFRARFQPEFARPCIERWLARRERHDGSLRPGGLCRALARTLGRSAALLLERTVAAGFAGQTVGETISRLDHEAEFVTQGLGLLHPLFMGAVGGSR